jgi:nicotinamide mononucleotide transporter
MHTIPLPTKTFKDKKSFKQWIKIFDKFDRIILSICLLVNLIFITLNFALNRDFSDYKTILLPILSFLGININVICILLIAKRRIENFYFGFFACAMYGTISLFENNYGSMILNICFYIPMQFICFYMWNKKKHDNAIETRKLTLKSNLICIAIVLTCVAAFAFLLSTDAMQNVWDPSAKDREKDILFYFKITFDSGVLWFSILAQILMLMRFRNMYNFVFCGYGCAVCLWGISIFYNVQQKEPITNILTAASMLFSYGLSFFIAHHGYKKWS